MTHLFKKHAAADDADTRTPGDDIETAAMKRQQALKDQRLFLHLLSVFQREGRLVDFFFEDLAIYEDHQIGAAVRTIHQNCNKILSKYLTISPVINKNEGDDVTVEQGFEPATVKLTGNVTGEPPFNGVLRHRGWQVASLDLPTLSGTGGAKIIAPAEVEVK